MAIDFGTFYNIVDGNHRGSEKSYHGVNPTTEEELWPVPVATEADLEDAVSGAKNAFKGWSQTSLAERQESLKAFGKAVEAYKTELTDLLMKETGKPAFAAQSEVDSIKAQFDAHAEYEMPEHVSQDDDVVKIVTSYVPIGVVGAITPWNFPLSLGALKIAPALLVGCTVILKPSPFTPYTSLKLVEIGQQVLPPGVLQVLGGDEKLGPWIVRHPDIPKIAFTGSSATGKIIQEKAAKYIKRVTLELGGNDAAIVFPDADIPLAAKGIAMGAFFLTGQMCIAVKRIFIHSSIYDTFLSALRSAVAEMPVGPSTSPTSIIGPVQNQMQFDKVQSLYADSASNSHTVAYGSTTSPRPSSSQKGYFLSPTIISNPPTSSRIMQEEPFGPIVPTQPWDEVEDVIERANATRYGLSATIWSADVEIAKKVAKRLEAGIVWINSGPRPMASGYFSGHKESGIGGEGGKLGLVHYCNAQTLYLYR